MIRYGNDVELSDLARQIHNWERSLQAHIMEGNLHGAFLRAHEMQAKIEKLKERLNDLKYGRAA